MNVKAHFIYIVVIVLLSVWGVYSASGVIGGSRQSLDELNRLLVASRNDATESAKVAYLSQARAAAIEGQLHSAQIKLDSIFGGIRIAQELVTDASQTNSDIQGTIRRVVENLTRVKAILRSILDLK